MQTDICVTYFLTDCLNCCCCFSCQSAEAMNMVKQDLSEFVSTIHHDTSAVVADTATAVKESLKVHVK